MVNISLTLYTKGFFGSFLKSPTQIGSLSINNSVTNISRLGTFQCGFDLSLECGSWSHFLLRCGSGSCSSSKWCESAITGLPTLQGSILSLHASILNDHGPPRLRFEPLKLLNFDSHAFHSNVDPDPASQINADLDPRIRNPGLSTCTYMRFYPLLLKIGISALQRLVFSSTGPLDRDYDDLRRFSGKVLFFVVLLRLHVRTIRCRNQPDTRQKCREVFLKNNLLEERVCLLVECWVPKGCKYLKKNNN